MQWQHHYDDNVHQKGELDGIDTWSIELSPCKAKRKPTKTKNTQKHTKHRTRNKNPTRHDTNTVRLVISWSINRNWNVSEKMITSTRQRQITKKPYRNLWAWEATQHNAETEAPPSQEPRDHKAQAARATISPIGNNLTESKGQQWHCHGTRKVRSKRWNVVWTRAKVKRQTRKRHLEPPQIPLRCALSIFTITKTLTIVRWVIAVSRVRCVGTGSIKMLRRFLHLCVYSCLHEYHLLACVPSVRRSCSLMMPDRSSVRCSDVQVASSDCWTQARLLAQSPKLVTGSRLFCFQSWISHVGYFRGELLSGTSAKIEHNSNRCHGEMYFDIVLVYCHQNTETTEPLSPNRILRTHRKTHRTRVSHLERGSRCTVQPTSHGSSMLVGVAFLWNNLGNQHRSPMLVIAWTRLLIMRSCIRQSVMWNPPHVVTG